MKAKMIRHPDARFGEEALYYFRRTYTLCDPKGGSVKILADARYKLWVNGQFVSCGPCKGSRHMRYYDEVDLTPYLVKGENTFFVTLLNLHGLEYMDVGDINLNAVIRSGEGFLAIAGTVLDGEETVVIRTDKEWQTAEETHVSFTTQFYVGMNEHVTPGFGVDLVWKNAAPSPMVPRIEGDDVPYGGVFATYAEARPIPMMTYIPREFGIRDGYLDAGELMTGYIRLRAKGKGKITLTYGECFVKDGIKGDRTDTTGTLMGHDDTFVIDGALDFESFWFRTFRFVGVATEGEVEIEEISYVETGYPLVADGTYDFGCERDNALWEISLRTLRRCMQETYVDCPYYEQLQYCMDTYSQTLFTYMVSADTRLARRALNDFAMTWRPGYLTECRAPSCLRQYIPGFSLFFIFMVNMYEARTEDTEYIRPLMPVVDGILTYFESQLNEAGLVKAGNMWDFVDWAEDWRKHEGSPINRVGEGITVYTMMYVHALRCAARLQRLVGRGAVAEEYLVRGEAVLESLRKNAYDGEKRLWADSERKEQFSQHAQIWATLTGLAEGEEAKDLLRRSLDLSAQCGYAYAYLWFRALEKADCYELSEEMYSRLYGLLDSHCSTIPETPYSHTRSECHAWGAVALYEFTTMTLGVKLRDDSPRVLKIAPTPRGTSHASGRVYTKWGAVDVAWRAEEGVFHLTLTTPPTVAAEITVPSGFGAYKILLNGKEVPPYAVK